MFFETEQTSIINNEILHPLISKLSSLLTASNFLSFSLLNKQIHSTLYPHICQSITFSLNPSSQSLKHYSPTIMRLALKCGDEEYLPRRLPFKKFDMSPLLRYFPSITHLTFGFHFNQPVELIPTTVTHLSFGFMFNQRVDHLHHGITHVVFGILFLQPIDHLPSSVVHVVFTPSCRLKPSAGIESLALSLFNQCINNLPPNLLSLSLSSLFNKPVKRLPSKLTHIVFGDYFNQPVDELPSSITHITFGKKFKQPIQSLPASVTHVTFGGVYHESYKQYLNNVQVKVL
jgi:hypothetical protein